MTVDYTHILSFDPIILVCTGVTTPWINGSSVQR